MLSRSLVLCVVILASLFIFTPSISQAQTNACDICAGLKNQGVFNREFSSMNETDQYAFLYALSTLDAGQAVQIFQNSQNVGLNITVPVEGIPIPIGGDFENADYKKNYQEWQRTVQEQTKTYSQRTHNQITQKVIASPELINGIVRCAEVCSASLRYGLFVSAERQSQNTAIVKVKYVPVLDCQDCPKSATVNEDVILEDGVKVSGAPAGRAHILFAKGTQLGNSTGQIALTLSDTNNHVINLDTSYGRRVIYIPEYSEPAPPPAPVEVKITSPLGNQTIVADTFILDFPITLAPGQRIRTTTVNLIDVSSGTVVRTAEIAPAQRGVIYLTYVQSLAEDGAVTGYPYPGRRRVGIIYIPRARFEITIVLDSGLSKTFRSGIFTIDRRN